MSLKLHRLTADHQATRRGFTLVELMMAAAMVVMIGAAVAALANAVSAGWQSSQASDALQMTARQSMLQIERLLRRARHVGLATSSDVSGMAPQPARLMFWQGDSDWVMRLGEVVLLEHDLTARRLLMYQVPASSPAANQVCSTSDINQAEDAQAFKAIAGVTLQTLANGVDSVRFVLWPAGATASRPSVEIVVGFSVSGLQRTEYRTVTLRAPTTQASN
jgi:Tfp pilus assembly protein PilE